jgi:hypothetical protein
MSFSLSDAAGPSPFVVRAELALRSLKQRVTTHADRESRLCRMYGEWQETWLSRAEQLRRQCNELEARLSPWMPRLESPRLAVVEHADDANE